MSQLSVKSCRVFIHRQEKESLEQPKNLRLNYDFKLLHFQNPSGWHYGRKNKQKATH